MVKYIQTIRRLLPTNSLGVFDDFVGLGLKEVILVNTDLKFFNFSKNRKYDQLPARKSTYIVGIYMFNVKGTVMEI